MNRILPIENKFRVIVTPSYVSSPSFELLLGNWTDQKLRGYQIVEFNNLEDAQELAFQYPTIDWNKMISLHEDAFILISNTIHNALRNGSFIVEIDSHLADPTELKETMFSRVLMHGNRFNTFYNTNDVICINIINPWTTNLVEIATLLKNLPELKIKRIVTTKTHIKLIGLTDVNTTYEIRLWTTIVAQWTRWIYKNKINPRAYISMLSGILEQQKAIDAADIIR